MAQDKVFYEKIERIFDSKTEPVIMGILNVTPDSFYDGGKYIVEKEWLEQTSKMLNEGATIVDIGAYSSRPGAIHITEEEESDRLIKVIESIRKHFPEVIISADTFRASIAEKAVNAGANIINDISGGTMDEKMFETVAKLQVPYVLMHIKGTPQTMQINPTYNNVTQEVYSFFEEKLAGLKKLGLKKVILDPGFGFGKTVGHNKELLNNMAKFQSFGCPLLVGLSRKSFINKILNINIKDTLNGTVELNKIALQNGANILRVHDVKEAKELASCQT